MESSFMQNENFNDYGNRLNSDNFDFDESELDQCIIEEHNDGAEIERSATEHDINIEDLELTDEELAHYYNEEELAYYDNVAKKLAENEIAITNWEAHINPLCENFQQKIRTIDPTSKNSAIVINVNSHGTFEGAEQHVYMNENDITPTYTDEIPDYLSKNVVILSYSSPNTIALLDFEGFRETINLIKRKLIKNMPILSVFHLARRAHLSLPDVADKRAEFKKKIDTGKKDKQYMRIANYFIGQQRKKRTYEIYNPLSNMRFVSDKLNLLLENRGINLTIKILDVRYPLNTQQLDLMNPESNSFTHFERSVVKLTNDCLCSSLVDIISFLKKEYLFDAIFIVISTCRYKEFETKRATDLFENENFLNNRNENETKNQLQEAKIKFFRNNNQQLLRAAVRKGELSTRGGSRSHNRRKSRRHNRKTKRSRKRKY